MANLPPPRLWIVHRPEHHHALVIRRGPSKQVAFFGWDRKTNEVVRGQWLKGRIYPRRCDLSPDGRHIIYFAYNGRWQQESLGSWTAVSRYPYLKALDFWPKGDAWNGGGLFLSNQKYLLYERFPHQQSTFSGEFQVKKGIPNFRIMNNECLGIYIPKLMRDGWKYEGRQREEKDQIITMVKRVNSQISVQKWVHATISPPKGKGVYYEEHQILGIDYKPEYFKDVENLDCYQETLFWPYQGKIYTAKVRGDFIDEAKEVHDFTDYKFEAVKAPY